MTVAADDWRRRRQEEFLLGASLTWRRYQALRADWEHEHCAFCFQKFLDARYSDWATQALQDAPHKNDPAGYTTAGGDGNAAGDHWICEGCYGDFAEEFGWVVQPGDPEAWPYDSPEPAVRPRAADFKPRNER